MNAHDLKPLYKRLLPDFPGFAAHRSLFLTTPMRGMLRAVHCDPSAFSKDDFHVAAFVMPLCVPSEHISLLFGERLRHPGNGSWGWSKKSPGLLTDLSHAIRSRALPFLEAIQSADDFATMSATYWANPHAPKETAFVLARAGQHERAVSIIDDLIPRLDVRSSWQQTILEDTTNLRHLLLNDPNEAQRKLGEWENYTIRKLRLEAFR